MSPLSELVWSSDEGLSIKIAASSVTRKASLRWNADTLNIAISSPQQSGGDKSGENIDASVRDSEKTPSQIRSGSESSMRISTANPNITRITDAQQAASIRSLDQDSRCCREVNLLNKVEEVSDNDHIDRMELQEEIGNHSISCCKDASHHHTSCPASRKGVMSHTAEKELHCATTVHGGSSWANNAWRARLVETIGLKNPVLQNKAANTQSPSSIGNLGNARNIEGKLTGFQGDEHNKHLDNVNKDTSAIAASQFHHKLQGRTMQENRKDDPVVVRCESASCFNPRNLEKGKEKVVYNNSNCVSNTKESDDSNESIESCPSTKIPKRKHVHCATIKLPFGNKRCRGEDNESSCSGLVLKSGSSFFNWMSTLTNGSIMFDESTPVPLDRKLSSAIREGFVSSPVSHQNDCSVPLQSVGFNSLFQSLYCHDVMITSRHSHHQTESNHTDHIPNRVALDLESGDCLLDKPICMGTETFHMATETLAANNLQMICAGDTGNSQNQVGPLPLRPQGNLKLSNSSNKSCSRSPEEKENEFCGCSSNMPIENGGGSAESFWVTRLLPRNSMNLVDATPCNVKSDFCTINPKGLDDKLYCSSQQKFGLENECNNIEFCTSKGSNKEITSKCPALPSEKLEQPETMASVFAKRLDVLRHANTSSVCLPITCGHGTPTGENHRTNSFVANYNSHDGLQMEQENHISPSKDGRIVLWLGDKCKEQEHNGSNEELQGKLISESEPQHCGASTAGKAEATHHDNLGAKQFAGDTGGSGVKFKEEALNSMENAPNSKQIVPYDTALNDICDESSIIFGALQRLRLSRSDIIRWLRSPIMHTTLDGFFLRLRFGKWEEALGGTGYRVARINGAVDGNHLSVTIRNSTCQVDSRFVSNHDFHEDELKAWWSAIMKGDCKLPSKEELERKLRERAIIRF